MKNLQTLDEIGIKYGTDKSSKGHDYLRHYERTLSQFRSDNFTLIEIGGLNGASLKMWEEYFPSATIVCVDINPSVAQYATDRIRVEIGNAASPAFLKSVLNRYGRPRIVLDDGSHRWDHQRISFEEFLPMIEEGGILIIEDIHTSFEPNFAGSELFPFCSHIQIYVDYLHQRGANRRQYEQRYGNEFSARARLIDSIEYIPRSVIIRKRTATNLPLTNYDSEPSTARLVSINNSPRTVSTLPAYGDSSIPASVKDVSPPPDYIISLSDVTCLPRQVIIGSTGILPDTFRRRNPRHEHVQLRALGDYRIPKLPIQPIETIDKPAFYFDGEHASHFGHITLEVASRLWSKAHLDYREYCFITSGNNADILTNFLKPFGVDRDQIVVIRSATNVKKLTISSQSYYLEGSASEQVRSVWNTIAEYYSYGENSHDIYVSRKKWKKQRVLINEEEVEYIFEKKGFKIIYPEEMSFSEQVSNFRNASRVAGPSGSSMYNLIYSRPGTRSLILASSRFITMNDALIHEMNGINGHYFTGSPIDVQGSPMLADWKIDIAKLSDHVDRWLDNVPLTAL